MKMLALHSKQVLIDGDLKEATIVIEKGKIKSVILGSKLPENLLIEDVGDLVIMPGLIDSHVHINEPGRTTWEGFDTATKAAAAGGITTLIDMPLNSSPVTTDKNSFLIKLEAAKGKCHVNCGFWGGLIPSSHDHLDDLLQLGVMGIKVFLTHSGIDDFPNVTREDILKSIETLKKHDALLMAHCELSSEHSDTHLLNELPQSYDAYLKSRPRIWEDDAIKMMIQICREHHIKTHIVHLSSSNSISQIQLAKDSGLPLTVETCPHYLYFNSEEIPDKSTIHKCAPPIREKENNDQLLEALKSELIDFVVTDHSPAPIDLKSIESGSFKDAWGGISSIQYSLSVMWTLARQKDITIPQLAKMMSENVAKFLGLEKRKGQIKVGYDADIVVWNPNKSYIASIQNLQHKHKISPYLGHRLEGTIEQTIVHGICVYKKGQFIHLNQGKIILKDQIE